MKCPCHTECPNGCACPAENLLGNRSAEFISRSNFLNLFTYMYKHNFYLVIVPIHLSPTKTVWNLTGIFLDNAEMFAPKRLTTVVFLVHRTKIVWPTAGLMKIFASQNVRAIPNVL